MTRMIRPSDFEISASATPPFALGLPGSVPSTVQTPSVSVATEGLLSGDAASSINRFPYRDGNLDGNVLGGNVSVFRDVVVLWFFRSAVQGDDKGEEDGGDDFHFMVLATVPNTETQPPLSE